VLATYGDVMGSLPCPSPDQRRTWKSTKTTSQYKAELEQYTRREMKNNSGGLLHKILWYRVRIRLHPMKNMLTPLRTGDY
jgi:hypothetical protein